MQERDVKKPLELLGGRVKLFRPLAMFDGHCDLGAKLFIYAFACGALSRGEFKAVKSQVMLSLHRCISKHEAEVGRLTVASAVLRARTGSKRCQKPQVGSQSSFVSKGRKSGVCPA